MPYAVRNTLLIAGFWAIFLLSGSYFVLGYQNKMKDRLQKENSAKYERLQDLQLLEKNRSDLQLHCDRLRDISLGKVGTLASQESPGETFDYILRELNRIGSYLVINFNFRGQDTFLSLMRRTYELRGHGKFGDFYRLLWFLENGPLFYDVFSIKMEPYQPEGRIIRAEEVSYTLIMHGFNRDEGPEIRNVTHHIEEPAAIADIVRNRPGRLFVEPRETKTVEPGNNQVIAATVRPSAPVYEKLPVVLAVTPNAAICKELSGKVVRLHKGDSYLGGTVRSINTQYSKIEIVYDQGAASQRTVTLTTAKN